MTKNHLKMRAAPRTWNIARKTNTFITRPNPGGQSLEMTLPLSQVLRELNLGSTKKELNFMLRSTPVLINGTRRWDYRFPVGFMDVIAIPELKNYSVLSMDSKGRLAVEATTEKGAASKLAQVRSSSKVAGGKLQLHLSDGRNVLVAKPILAGTTVSIAFEKKNITSEHPVETKAAVILTSGKHRGKRGTIESIEGEFVAVKTADGTISTKKDYAFVLGGKA